MIDITPFAPVLLFAAWLITMLLAVFTLVVMRRFHITVMDLLNLIQLHDGNVPTPIPPKLPSAVPVKGLSAESDSSRSGASPTP